MQYNKALQYNPTSSSTLWNRAFAYFLIDDCVNGMKLLERYKATTPKENWDETDLSNLARKCK